MRKPTHLTSLLTLAIGLSLCFSPVKAVPPQIFVTLYVDTTTDSNAPTYQLCTTAAGDCTLRGAIAKANANGSAVYIIELPANTYTLLLSGTIEDANATGNLGSTGPVPLRV